jgi:hypothetical protein
MFAWLILSNFSSVEDEYLDAGQSFMNALRRTCCLEASGLTPNRSPKLTLALPASLAALRKLETEGKI